MNGQHTVVRVGGQHNLRPSVPTDRDGVARARTVDQVARNHIAVRAGRQARLQALVQMVIPNDRLKPEYC